MICRRARVDLMVNLSADQESCHSLCFTRSGSELGDRVSPTENGMPMYKMFSSELLTPHIVAFISVNEGVIVMHRDLDGGANYR